jgi:hypothetical protein
MQDIWTYIPLIMQFEIMLLLKWEQTFTNKTSVSHITNGKIYKNPKKRAVLTHNCDVVENVVSRFKINVYFTFYTLVLFTPEQFWQGNRIIITHFHCVHKPGRRHFSEIRDSPFDLDIIIAKRYGIRHGKQLLRLARTHATNILNSPCNKY